MKKNYFVKKATSLQYNTKEDNAPKITAQGTGYNAKRIINIANEHNIPIKKDEDLINMLSQIELNQEIPNELYKAVGEIFGYIYELTKEDNEKNT